MELYQLGHDTTASSMNPFPVGSDGRFWRYGLLCRIWRLCGCTGGSCVSRLGGVGVAVGHGLLDYRLQTFLLRFVAVDNRRDVRPTAWRWARRGSRKGMCTAATSGCLDWSSSRNIVRGRLLCRNSYCLQDTPNKTPSRLWTNRNEYDQLDVRDI